MFTEYQIAQARYAELQAKYHQTREHEGVTVQKPSKVARALLTVVARISQRQLGSQRMGQALRRSEAIAR